MCAFLPPKVLISHWSIWVLFFFAAFRSTLVFHLLLENAEELVPSSNGAKHKANYFSLGG